MGKIITNVIPELFALSYLREIQESSNSVIVSKCIDITTSEFYDVVIKLNNNDRMTNDYSLIELLALLIADELGINFAQPNVVYISKEFVQNIDDITIRNKTAKSIGKNFATKYIEQSYMINMNDIKPNDVAKLLDVFVFDLFIENVDRRAIKPNLLETNFNSKKDYYVIDHELAFSFALDILPKSPIEQDIYNMAKDHILFNCFKGRNNLNFSIEQKLKTINNSFWQRAETIIPNEMFNLYYFKKIKNYLNLKIENLDSFMNVIKGVLS